MSETQPHCECCRYLAEAREEARRLREGFPSHGVMGCVDRRVFDKERAENRALAERVRELEGEPCALCGGVGYLEEDHGPHGIERIGCPCEGLPVAQAKLKARVAALESALREIASEKSRRYIVDLRRIAAAVLDNNNEGGKK